MSRQDTRLRVVEALDARMRTCSLDRVKVTELCRDAGISRATFYECFRDVHDVATWAWDFLMQGTLYQMGVTLGCYTAHLRKFEVLHEHVAFFGNAMRIVSYSSICQHGGRYMEEHMARLFRQKAHRDFTPAEALQVEFFNTGAKHMTRHWVERGMAEPPEQMAELFCSFVPEFMLPYLEADEAKGIAPGE